MADIEQRLSSLEDKWRSKASACILGACWICLYVDDTHAPCHVPQGVEPRHLSYDEAMQSVDLMMVSARWCMYLLTLSATWLKSERREEAATAADTAPACQPTPKPQDRPPDQAPLQQPPLRSPRLEPRHLSYDEAMRSVDRMLVSTRLCMYLLTLRHAQVRHRPGAAHVGCSTSRVQHRHPRGDM